MWSIKNNKNITTDEADEAKIWQFITQFEQNNKTIPKTQILQFLQFVVQIKYSTIFIIKKMYERVFETPMSAVLSRIVFQYVREFLLR